MSDPIVAYGMLGLSGCRLPQAMMEDFMILAKERYGIEQVPVTYRYLRCEQIEPGVWQVSLTQSWGG